MSKQKCDAVFEGGGVNGVALCGAVNAIERTGYEFNRVAGTSAGAIVAALIAAGYNAADIHEIIAGVDYSRFKDKSLTDMVPIVGPLVSLFKNKGYYGGDYFLGWMRDLMENSPRKVKRFGDLKMSDGKYRLSMIAADITRRRMLVLPYGVAGYRGLEPDDLEIALAVRMSMSIPIFFEPVKMVWNTTGMTCHVVDGGLLSNFPVWLFDRRDGEPPRWPTFGFRLVDFNGRDAIDPIGGPIDLVKALVVTMLDAHDATAMLASDRVRTIDINTLGNSGVNFDINSRMRQRLYMSGFFATKTFLSEWNFDEYVATFRQCN